jgi:peptidoglycan/xylan/chitin deacetylase (PgdA/CDA1 family)
LIRDSGNEIGIQGYNHDGKLYYSEKIFTERAEYINRALKEYQAVGFRSPMVQRNLSWLQKLDIEYDASCFDYDPFQPFPGGTGSIWPFQAGKLIELPYTMPQDHVLFYILREKSSTIWKNKAYWIAKNHGVILMLTHPDYLKEKDHLKYYEETLQYLSTFKNVWHCLPHELAAHFRIQIENVSSKPRIDSDDPRFNYLHSPF